MRILYVVSLFPCWSETFIVRELEALLRRGDDVRILSLKPPQERLVQPDAQALCSRVIYPAAWPVAMVNVAAAVVRHPWKNMKLLGAMIRGLWRRPVSLAKSLVVWWRTLGCLPAVRRWRPDMVHAHWATYPSTGALILSEHLGVPFSFTSHAHDIFLEDQLLQWKIRAAAFGVTISRFNCRFLEQERGLDLGDKMRVIHCGVRLAEFRYDRSRKRAGKILAVARLVEMKGLDTLVRACARLRDQGVDFECEIIGDGPLRGQLDALIRELRLEPRVRLAGARAQDAVRESLLEAAVFVLPAVVDRDGGRDGIPVSLMEAMAVGTPVVSTTVSGIPELIEDGVTGLLAPPGDVAALAEALVRLLSSPGLQESLARAARQRIEREFDVEKEAAKLHRLFHEVAGEAG